MTSSCPVCFEDYSSNRVVPKVLVNCGHTVCEGCIQRMVVCSQVACPTCRIPSNVRRLVTNYETLAHTALVSKKTALKTSVSMFMVYVKGSKSFEVHGLRSTDKVKFLKNHISKVESVQTGAFSLVFNEERLTDLERSLGDFNISNGSHIRLVRSQAGRLSVAAPSGVSVNSSLPVSPDVPAPPRNVLCCNMCLRPHHSQLAPRPGSDPRSYRCRDCYKSLETGKRKIGA